jgi:organic hydroperoxide reductase OsmC/OhrA
MSEHRAIVHWKNDGSKFIDNKYSREHIWKFDGEVEIFASASPKVVPIPYSNPVCIDPEEAFIASLSSCHMLWFLSIAAKNKFVVESYLDRVVGIMEKNQDGKLAIAKVYFHPQIIFAENNLPTTEKIQEIHEEAHQNCFLANSVKTEIIIE